MQKQGKYLNKHFSKEESSIMITNNQKLETTQGHMDE
jgi:hypothetical protein